MRALVAVAFVLALTMLGGAAPQADVHIVVTKGARTLSLYDAHDHLVKSYRIALGAQPTGPKREEGDGATPEGEYYVTHGNSKSKFHLSLGLSYPNVADAGRGLSRGVISKAEHASIAEAIEHHERPPQHTRLGGDIFLHGGGTSKDWTAGCIALEDGDIEELFARIPLRTAVTIRP